MEYEHKPAEWTFFGRIHPESIPIGIGRREYDGTVDGLGVAYRVTLDVAQSQFICNMRITQGDADIHTLRNCVESCIRAETDLVGYLFGGSFDVEVISARNPDSGDSVVFGVTIPVLRDRREPVGSTLSFPSELLIAVGASLQTQAALAYFREAIRIPVDTGFFCYRAIEACLVCVAAVSNKATSKHWEIFRETLNVSKEAVLYVKNHADEPRHGKASAITDEQRANVFRITDEILRRHLHWLTHGMTQLAVDEFPTLLAR